MNRPLVWVALALAAGTFTSKYSYSAPVLTGAFLFLALLLALAGFAHRLRRFSEPVLIFGIFFIAGVAVAMWRSPAGLPPHFAQQLREHPKTVYTMEGTVLEATLVSPPSKTRGDSGYQQFIMRSECKSVPGKVLVRWYTTDPDGVLPGERVRVRSRLTTRLGTSNFGIAEAEDHYLLRDIPVAAQPRGSKAVEITGRNSWSFWYWAGRLRRAEADLFRRIVPPSAQPFVIAAWLGERGQLGDAQYDDFMLSGTAHILAVSGINVTILYAGLAYVLRLLGPRSKLKAYGAVAVVAVFALTSGAQVSVLRASVMIALDLAADLLNREPDTASALSLSAILFLLWQPALMFDPGFLLSFSSVASILVFMDPLQQRMARLPHGLREGLGMSLSAQILPFPIAVRLMNCLPLASPLTNLIAVPLFSAILWLTFLTLLVGSVWEHAALIPGHALGALVSALLAIVHYAAQLPHATLFLTTPQPAAMAAFWCAAMIAAYALQSSDPEVSMRRWWGCAGLCLILTVVLWKPLRHEAAVDFLDVGHGDAAIIQTGDGRAALVDTGAKTEHQDMGERVVARALWARGITRLDAVVISHTDSDHVGGLDYILRHFHVNRLVMTRPASRDKKGMDIRFWCLQRKIPIAEAKAGDIIALGPKARLEALHPPLDWPQTASANDTSLVVRLRWKGPDILFAGDVEAAGEAALASTDCAATVLKAPHHASHTSSTEPFLRTANPSTVIVSTGGMAGREPASPEVLDRYKRMGMEILRTDIAGGIRILPVQGRAVIQTAREYARVR